MLVWLERPLLSHCLTTHFCHYGQASQATTLMFYFVHGMQSESLHSSYLVSHCGPWAGFCSKLPGRPPELCYSSNWALSHQDTVKKPKHKAYTKQTSGPWHKLFWFPDTFEEVCSMINTDITSLFQLLRRATSFGGGDVWAHTYLVVLLAPAPAILSLTTLIPWLLQCILSLPWGKKAKLRTSYLPQGRYFHLVFPSTWYFSAGSALLI